MTKKLFLLTFSMVLTAFNLFAQRQPVCGFDHAHNQLMQQSANYAYNVNEFNTKWATQQKIANQARFIINGTDTVYEIPVVVHVIYDTNPTIGSVYNPSNAQINSMIAYLNDTYAAQWAAYPDTNNGGVRVPMKFVLAKRDPNCGPTTGINRVSGASVPGYSTNGIKRSGTLGADEATIKNLSIWPNTDYYNIWIVNKIDGKDGITGTGTFVAGYAYMAGTPAPLDGTIMLASQAVAGSITLPHEIGHAFNLYHTFNGSVGTTCATNNNCNFNGDFVCDTDPVLQTNFNCPLPTDINVCTGTPYGFLARNFMDYSNCQDRFTPGQRARMRAALLGARLTLAMSTGAVAPPPSLLVASSCIPTINPANVSNTFNAGINRVRVITPGNVSLIDNSTGTYTGDGSKVYLDKTCSQTATLIPGTTYNIRINNYSRPGQKVKVYIDFNNDGTFNPTAYPAGELITSGTAPNNTNFSYSFNFLAPTTGITFCTPLRMRCIMDTSSNIGPCSQLEVGQAEDYALTFKPTDTGAYINTTLTAGTMPDCANAPLTFTTTKGSSLTTVTYKWYKNNIVIPGATSNVLTTANLNNFDTVTCRVFYTSFCGADSLTSEPITIIRLPTNVPSVSVAITAGTNPSCAGQPITFKATATNGGAAPVYTWSVNGITVGTNSDTYSANNLLNNDIVTCTLTSNASCAIPASVTSSQIKIIFSPIVPTVTLALTNGTNPACAIKPVTLSANPSFGGATPQYAWYKNGVLISGATASSYTTIVNTAPTTLKCVMTSNHFCAMNVTARDSISFTIRPADSSSVAMSLTKGNNPSCQDSLLEFTGTYVMGSNPVLSWLVNGATVATGNNVYSSISLLNNDLVSFRVIATDGGCYATDTLTSPAFLVLRTSLPTTPFISFIGNILSANIPGPLQWYGPNGAIPGATGQTYKPLEQGLYYAINTNGACQSRKSNILSVSLLDIASINKTPWTIYPNPSNQLVTLTWNDMITANVVVTNYTGQVIMRKPITNANSMTFDFAPYANGNYFIIVTDTEGNSQAQPVTIIK